MKKTSPYIILLLIISIGVFCSCNSDKKIVDNLYEQRQYLLKEFKNKSIISRSGIFYQLSYYKGSYVNTFYFEKKNNNLLFTNDTLQYPVNEITAFASVNIGDSLNCREAISSEFHRLLKVMEDFCINHVSAEDRYAGIDMKIYFGGDKALLYVKNVAGIKNERWKSYVASGKSLDSNWYYINEER